MKDFDAMLPTDREFTVGGETFHWRDVRPEVLEKFEPEEGTEASVWKIYDQQIMLFLETDEREKWNTVRASDDKVVTIKQIQEILKWLLEEQTGHPTEQPAPSEVGRGKTAVTSKAA